MAYYEERYVALYGNIVNLITYKNLTSGELRTIDQYDVKKDPNMPRKISYVDLITATGAECLKRATIEFQKRFMGNKMGVLFGDEEPDIDIMDQALMATVLDLHTTHMSHLPIEKLNRALEVIKVEYVEFYLQRCRYNKMI